MSHEAADTFEAAKTARGARRWLVPGAMLALAISAIQLLFLFCLSYPPLHPTPKHVPMGVVGPAAVVAQVEAKLDQAGPDAFDFRQYADADAARSAIRNRDIYGAVVVSASGPTMLVSSAANSTIAGLLKAQAAGMSPTGQVPVEDVVPASRQDPNGSGFLATVLPLTLLSLALGIGVALSEKRRLYAVAWIGMAATSTAAFASWIAHGTGTFTDTYWGTLIVLLLLVFGIAVTSAGLTRLGNTGRVLDLTFALLLLCIGIPSAGALVPSAFLVEPWRALGPLLPPGAAVNALRGLNFFDGASVGGSLWMLIMWVLIGLALILGPLLRRRPAQA